MTKILIVEARFYGTVHDLLLEGVTEVLKEQNISYHIETTGGALEIPALVSFGETSTTHHYHGYICLGCIIRGETTHYDYVCEQAFRGIMDLSVRKNLAISNGILTVENEEQALFRADKKGGNKGGMVARACLNMIAMKKKFNLYTS